jgi:F-type H+-transporting ATPase subunit a
MLDLVRSNFHVQSPLDQFEIRDLISLNVPFLMDLHISLTNIGLYLILGGFITIALNVLAQNYNRLVSNS